MIELPITAASFEGSGVPAHIQDGIARYINHGDPVGGILTAFLDNDLCGAFRDADVASQAAMFYIVKWFYNFAPSFCWGSTERRVAWQAKGGALGFRGATPRATAL